MKRKPLPKNLSDLLTYCPESGRLFWKERSREKFKCDASWMHFNKRHAGKEAGSRHSQHGRPTSVNVIVTVDGKMKSLLAHHIIYQIMGVEIPDGMEVDHRNRNPWDNRWVNLRIATPSQNSVNKLSGSKRKPENEHLPRGVTKNGNKFQAGAMLDGKHTYIGLFDTPEEASQAYRNAVEHLHGEFFYQRSSGLS